MATVRGCNIPEDRYYWVEKHAWARPEADGTVTIGITDVAQNMAKRHCQLPRRKMLGVLCKKENLRGRWKAASGWDLSHRL